MTARGETGGTTGGTALPSAGDSTGRAPRNRIIVLGVGGAGCHAAGLMTRAGLAGATIVAVDTDWASVRAVDVGSKIELRCPPVYGLGAGGIAGWAAGAAEMSAADLRAVMARADLALIVAGLGGGTGSGAGPVIARLVRACGAVAVALVTQPLTIEGRRREAVAAEGLAAFRAAADAVLVAPCEGLLRVTGGAIPLAAFYSAVDGMLHEGVRALVGATLPGVAMVDIAELADLFRGAGPGVLTYAGGRGAGSAASAARAAVASTLLSRPLDGATRVLIRVRGGRALIVQDIAAAGAIVAGAVRADATIAMATAGDALAGDDEATVSILAAGYGPG